MVYTYILLFYCTPAVDVRCNINEKREKSRNFPRTFHENCKKIAITFSPIAVLTQPRVCMRTKTKSHQIDQTNTPPSQPDRSRLIGERAHRQLSPTPHPLPTRPRAGRATKIDYRLPLLLLLSSDLACVPIHKSQPTSRLLVALYCVINYQNAWYTACYVPHAICTANQQVMTGCLTFGLFAHRAFSSRRRRPLPNEK